MMQVKKEGQMMRDRLRPNACVLSSTHTVHGLHNKVDNIL